MLRRQPELFARFIFIIPGYGNLLPFASLYDCVLVRLLLVPRFAFTMKFYASLYFFPPVFADDYMLTNNNNNVGLFY